MRGEASSQRLGGLAYRAEKSDTPLETGFRVRGSCAWSQGPSWTGTAYQARSDAQQFNSLRRASGV